ANLLTLAASDVLALTGGGPLQVLGDALDALATGPGWIDAGLDGNGNRILTQAVGGQTAVLVVDLDIALVDTANALPLAAADVVATATDAAVTLPVLGNDTNPDGPAPQLASVTQGANGTVAVNPDGTLTYTPDPGFSGTDSFDYTIDDGQGGAAGATVTVQVGVAIEGTAGTDSMIGTNQADAIFGYAGADTIDGGNSGDTLYGGDGNDILDGGGNGADSLYGGAGDDILIGGNGVDFLDGGAGADQLFGGTGGDILIWDAADTLIDGGNGPDTLRAQFGDDMDLTAFAGTITDVETIDLASDAGSNALTLTAQDLLDMTDNGNTLTVQMGAGDVLNAGGGTWTQVSSVGGVETFTQTIGPDIATLIVDHDPAAVLNVAL
ncbi:MAG TPA: Ig-like domain-containing protein, partial [Kiloniellales bacterium]|nr:Ig-like domain-containing protein [Kiloniellales bacterium]